MPSELFEKIKAEPNKDYFMSYVLEDVVKQIEEKTIDYDQKIILLKEIDDPFHKLTLNYILWRKSKNYENAKNALNIITNEIKRTFENNWFNLGTFCIDMFFRLCRETNQKDDYKIEWTHNIFSFIFKYKEKMKIIHIIKSCEILLKYILSSKNVKEFNDDINSFDKILDEYILLAEKDENFHLHRTLIELKIELYMLLEKNANDLKYKIVKSFECEGDKKYKENNFIAANWFYNNSLTAAMNFNFKDDYERLKIRLKESGEKIEYKEIKVEIDLKPLTKSKLEQYKKEDDPLEKAIKDNSLIVTQRMIEDVQSSHTSSLSSIIPKVSFDEQGIRIASSTETTIVEKAQAMFLAEALAKSLRVNVMKYILEKIKIKDVLDIIKSREFLNKNTIELLNFGLEKIKEEDYISAVHILIPKIESILRDIITNYLGLSGIRFRRYGGGYEYITLGSILLGDRLNEDENEKIDKYLGEDFRYFLYFKLVMSEGENLRDDLSHGKLKKEKMNYEMCLDLIYIILRIIK